MPEQHDTILHLSEQEHIRLETIAHNRGYKSVSDYIRELIEMDAARNGETFSVNPDQHEWSEHGESDDF
jgi:Arc/MetJ-type ribon-helix-helix transcriptional regulator